LINAKKNKKNLSKNDKSKIEEGEGEFLIKSRVLSKTSRTFLKR
jgi:hypothetical protein